MQDSLAMNLDLGLEVELRKRLVDVRSLSLRSYPWQV